MTTFNVSTTAALNSALANAHGGDTILLGSGTYAGVSINNLKFTEDVTIASATPGAPAVLAGLNIGNSMGLTLQGLELKPGDAAAWSFTIGSSSDIHFSDLKVHGSLDNNPLNDPNGVLIRDSSDISITNSEFQQLANAIGHLNVEGLVIRGNNIHDIRSDGIQGGGSSNVVIDANTFRNFFPASTDHPDAIQFFTTNSRASAHDITITDNVIMRGTGRQMQGIFLGEEVGTLPYLNVKIAGNFLAGTMYNGIYVYNGRGIVVDDNVVQGFSDMTSWISLTKVTGGALTDNAATSFQLSGLSDVANTGSTTLALATDQGAAAYQAWLAGNSTTPPPADPEPPVTQPPASPFAGTAGPDTLVGTANADSITGQDGNDSLGGGAGADTLDGGAGADTLSGNAGVNVLRGGDGNDYYLVGAGDTVIEATTGAAGGIDLIYSYANFTLGANQENLQLSGAVDGIGNELANSIVGDGGVNRLQGRAGADTLNGRDGADILEGGAGADLLTGGNQADRFVLVRSEAQGEQIQDFAVGDRLELSGYSVGSTITKVAGSATDWKITDAATGSVEVIKLLNGYQLGSSDTVWQGGSALPANPPASPFAGTAGPDTLVGTANADSIAGQDGNDSLSGGAGADTLDGGAGADSLSGNAGANVLRGGDGNDYYLVGTGDTVIEATAGAAGGADLVYSYGTFTLGANLENLHLGSASAMDGFGNEIANSLVGNSGANRLEGRAGNDTLNGRDGADTLNGGGGADLLMGEGGQDRFILARGEANGDRIQDFGAGDRLQLSGYGAGSTIAKVAGSTTDWKITDAATGSVDVIKLLNAYQLSGGDYLFG
ncbi:MAG: hypothetical protein EPO51_14055 [Phenylobacterium sp.]|uniref:calcium-binding protein n=1 Tax=Phenylobacterium sp. TaxID=1871053 RepID=UPI001221912A|nr:right-handed parallel beta-helix repeat-containing protein [Phenylobacterium sp.]TAJ71411.1 MAG: hypothetical protein EPO51_14055 [Phenylobacterium sp.]